MDVGGQAEALGAPQWLRQAAVATAVQFTAAEGRGTPHPNSRPYPLMRALPEGSNSAWLKGSSRARWQTELPEAVLS